MNMQFVPDDVWKFNVFDGSRRPNKTGRYMLLSFEWVGLHTSKPQLPVWNIREWDGKDWQRKSYTFDTGGMDNFEAVAWCETPCTFWDAKQ